MSVPNQNIAIMQIFIIFLILMKYFSNYSVFMHDLRMPSVVNAFQIM